MGYKLTSNDEISLVMPDWHDGEEEYYEIILNNINEPVGFIEFNPKISKVTGNVEYGIFPEFRGNNYAEKALKLFTNAVYKISNNDLFLSILPNNKASIKTATGAGAIFIQNVQIPKKYIFSEHGKYKYAYMYIIKNERKKRNERNKIK